MNPVAAVQPLAVTRNVHDHIFDILFEQDEVTWQSLLMELVKSEHMDPWDIDISILSQKYVDLIKELQRTDLRISGKVLLAAAILLRVKANHLLVEDIAHFDNMLNDNDEDALYEENETQGFVYDKEKYKQLRLIPRTPQPRKRKVSIYDLIDALKLALDVQEKRRLRIPKVVDLKLPEKKFDLTALMTQVYVRLLKRFRKDENKKIYFTDLVPNGNKTAKIHTFVPLLHLTNQRKLDLEQEQHLGPIEVQVIKKNIDKDIEKEAEEY